MSCLNSSTFAKGKPEDRIMGARFDFDTRHNRAAGRRLVIQEDRTRLSLSGPLRDEIDYPADHDRGNVFRTPPGWAWWATTGGAFP